MHIERSEISFKYIQAFSATKQFYIID